MVEPPSIEVQIDSFLEQFKLSASRVMEEGSNIIRSRSSYLDDGDLPDDLDRSSSYDDACSAGGTIGGGSGGPCVTPAPANIAQPYQENQEKQRAAANDCTQTNAHVPSPSEVLRVNDIADVLYGQYAIITGGKSRDGCPLITFPDQTNFHQLRDCDYQHLMMYLTSVPSLQEADMGFHLIVDRRKDKWTSVKTVLLKISVYFPGLIHVVYVIRPVNIFQKAISEVSSKLFKDEFKFRMIVLSTAEDLLEFVDVSQLTADLGGSLIYVHHDWIQHRLDLEKFSVKTREVSLALDIFTKAINETEFPNTMAGTRDLLEEQSICFSRLKNDIIVASKYGEGLLASVRAKTSESSTSNHVTHTTSGDMLGYVFGIERLLVQLDETQRTFEEFWLNHSRDLNHCLDLRTFEQEFRELQAIFEAHLQRANGMSHIGEDIAANEQLLQEVRAFAADCANDVSRTEDAVAAGHKLLLLELAKAACPHECVMPKCEELTRVKEIIRDKIDNRIDVLTKCIAMMQHIEQTNKWCTSGLSLITDLDSASDRSTVYSKEQAANAILRIKSFLDSAADNNIRRSGINKELIPETHPLVAQVQNRVEDVYVMCEKKAEALKKYVAKARPILTVMPEPVLGGATSISRQPSVGAPQSLIKNELQKVTSLKMESAGGNIYSATEDNAIAENENMSPEDVRRAKQGHILAELLETERTYVAELQAIISGYKEAALLPEMRERIPSGLIENIDVLFGNIEEIYKFHAEIFLKDLENCICSTDLVALCFVQKRDTFLRLYSYYCQNIPRSEQLREQLTDNHNFLQECQRRLEHKLPLAAYLLKPVQRITKYQLMLKDLLKDASFASDHGSELQQALDCMLLVLKYVNDSMLQISIIGFPMDLSQQGDLLLQGKFQVHTENKGDLRLRIKPKERHLFLYQKMILFCKAVDKAATRTKTSYHFKNNLKMSEVGLTESVRSDTRRFEIWLQGRQEVYIIQAATLEQKHTWVNEIKRVLFHQLEELKGEKNKEYITLHNRHMMWDMRALTIARSPQHPSVMQSRTLSLDSAFRMQHFSLNHHLLTQPDQRQQQPQQQQELPQQLQQQQSPLSSTQQPQPQTQVQEQQPVQQQQPQQHLEEDNGTEWSSDYSNSDDEDGLVNNTTPRGRYVALADYCAVGQGEVSMWEGDVVDLLKVGCAGWWFVKVIDTATEGWAPAAYLENVQRKSSQCGSRSQDALNAVKSDITLKESNL